LAFDGQFIYVTSSSLRYLLKLGSGKKGTVKGLVYASEEIDPGWVVFVDGVLLHRKLSPEGGGAFCRLIDRNTLKVSVVGGCGSLVPRPSFTLELEGLVCTSMWG
jgi:hypothetical protein